MHRKNSKRPIYSTKRGNTAAKRAGFKNRKNPSWNKNSDIIGFGPGR